MSISRKPSFRLALNFTLIDFSAEGKQLDIHIDFESRRTFPCASCGKPGCSVHDTIEITWARKGSGFALLNGFQDIYGQVI